jgi:proline iminopeptidase
VAPLFPAQWARFRANAPADAQDDDLVAAYYQLLQNPDPTVHTKAASNWCDWEASLMSPDPDYKPSADWYDPAFQLTFARIVTHYFHHHAWLEDGILLRQVGKLVGIPGILIHGRLDLGAPLVTAWELAQAWPDSELVLVSGAGHTTRDPGMGEAIIAATDRFASRHLEG